MDEKLSVQPDMNAAGEGCRFRLKMAGICAEVETIYPVTRVMCTDYIDEEAEPDFTIRITGKDIDREEMSSFATDIAEGRKPVKYKRGYLETLAVYRQFCNAAALRNVVLFHASAIGMDGRAYLFTAPSGTGKSTHAALWKKVFGDRVVMINDDKPLLRFEEDGVFACGTPWDGKHRLSTNTEMKIAGICVIKRGEHNSIERCTDPLPVFLSQTYRPKDPDALTEVVRMVVALAQNVPVFTLTCNMDPEAAEVAYAELSKH
ncbi:MAG: hypothetical protein J6X47_07865 [Clostridia bacterium]|nr:hypothetical protein [Clostridia bacterium]